MGKTYFHIRRREKSIMSKVLFVILVLIIHVNYNSRGYAAQVMLSFQGEIDKVITGNFSVGQSISGKIIYDSNTQWTNFPTGSPPYSLNYSNALKKFNIGNLTVENISYNMLDQTTYSNDFLPQSSHAVPVEYSVRFSVSGTDSITGFWESLDVYLKGLDILENIFVILEDTELQDLSTATFQYDLQKIGVSGSYVEKRFLGHLTSLNFIIIPPPRLQPSFFLLLN